MGAVIGKAANGFGSVVGNAVVAPFKSIFGGSCQEVCLGPWDLVCFIEHLCVTDLVKLLMILGLCYITLLFFYLLFKLGLCQCIIKSLCKMCWAACETYWFALEDITCFLWHKLMNTKRVNRRRQRQRRLRDIEVGYSSSPESETHSDNYHRSSTSRKRKSYRERRKNPVPYHSSRHSRLRHNHVRLKTRGMSIRVKGGSRRLKNPRQLQLSKMRNLRRQGGRCKRRKLR